MTTSPVDLTAIIVNYNTKLLLRPCLDALRAGAEGLCLQIVIVDNASRDGSPEVLLREFADCDLLFNDINVGFGRANNQALTRAHGRYVLLLNTDAFVEPGAVLQTVQYLDEHPDCAVLGVRLVGRDGSLQPSCRYFPTPWNEFVAQVGLARFFPGLRLVDDMTWDHMAPRECDWVPGCYYLVRKTVLDQVGLFDDRFFLYYEEVDHCQAVKAAGWRVMYYPYTTVVHIGGESAKTDGVITAGGHQLSALQIESGLLYYRKHHGRTGLFLALLLSLFSDAVLAVKSAMRRRHGHGIASVWQRNTLMWSILRRTKFARHSTR